MTEEPRTGTTTPRPVKLRKPFGVWMLLQDGSPWMFDRHATLHEALLTARTLHGAAWNNPPGPLPFQRERVWIAAPPVVGRKPALARFRKNS